MARYFGIIPAAGKGERFGGGVEGLPKQYQPLAGRTVLNHAVDALAVNTPLTRVYVVHADRDAQCARVVGAGYRIATLSCGGASRARTVRNALAALRGELADDDWILVHDAARPCLPHSALMRLLRELGDDPVGGLLAIPVADTLKREAGNTNGNMSEDANENKKPHEAGEATHYVGATESRVGLWQAQTPQMFRFGLLFDAFKSDRALEATDEAQAIEMLGKRPRLIVGSTANIKVTYAGDLKLAESLLAAGDR